MSSLTVVEAGCVVVLVWLALLPLVRVVPLARRAPRRGRTVLLAVLGLMAPVLLTWAALQLREAPVPEAQVVGRPIAVPPGGYVTSRACAACHPGQYASWHRSYHRTMTQVATPLTVLGDFDGVHLAWKGRAYELSIDDEAAWVEMRDIAAPSSSRGVKLKVVMSTGSHHDQVYWLDAGRGDRVLVPFAFYHSKRLDRWVPTEAAYLADPNVYDLSMRSGDWNFNCIRCHATEGTTRFTSDAGPSRAGAFDTQVAEFGIACEACHGPAEAHVRSNSNPLHRLSQHLSDAPDGTITNPARLDHRRASRICGQCHSISALELQDDAPNRFGFVRNPYRPGVREPDPVVFLQPRYFDPDYPAAPHEREQHQAVQRALARDPDLRRTSFWRDGMVRVSGRDYSAMIESPCYERGELSCGSCHAMHKTAADARSLDAWAHYQLAPDRADNRACIQCHARFAQPAQLVAHTHHEPGGTGSSCYNCHMPYTTYGMLEGIRNHQIASPSAQESVDVGRPNACNLCHLDRTLAWTAQRLEQWYQTPRPALSQDQRTIAAGALWALTGEAGTRALTAYAMGWGPAVAASGGDWTAPFLSQLLADPYAAVRYIAAESLARRPGFAGFDYDFVVPGSSQADALSRAHAIWSAAPPVVAKDSRPALLRGPDGGFQYDELERLLRQRDDTPVFLAE